MRFNFLFVCCILGLLSCESTPAATDLKTPKSGAEIYSVNCVVCHGDDGSEGIGGAANLQTSVYSIAEIKDVILNGNDKGMMPYKGLIDEGAELDSLVQFVQNLRN